MIVEIHGLEVFGRHGVGEDERASGQTLLLDVTLEFPDPREDSIDATLDYRVVRDAVRETSDARSYNLLESLARAVADEIGRRFPVDSVRVRARKPGIAWADWTAATVEWRR